MLLALALDLVFEEPPRSFHPVVWAGKVISLLERGGYGRRPLAQFLYGMAVTLFTVALFAKGFTQDLLLESGVFLVSVKLILISYKNAVTVESIRGQIQAVAIVTKRFKPFQLNGKTVHQIGLPWHWGFAGLCFGDSANKLTPHVGDANTMIPEYKAFLVKVTKGGV